jgi:signal transduction histidine kinase
MLHSFLANNRAELIARCADKVKRRPKRNASEKQLQTGIPMFIDQLTQTLKAEQEGETAAGLRISGAAGGDRSHMSELGVTAAAHGTELLRLGYTIDQVVHDYGDLCQAITDLAVERDAPFSIDEFRTLNRCLDNAIADAVTEFSYVRESAIAHQKATDLNEHWGFLMHELRNSLNAAMLAVSAMESGRIGLTGATGGVLKRSLDAMVKLVNGSLEEVRLQSTASEQYVFPLAAFIAEAKDAAGLDAKARGCTLSVTKVDPLLAVKGNRDLLLGAVANLLSNALKFTHAHTEVQLRAYGQDNRIIIEVRDNCGGLPPGSVERMFMPFTQHSDDKTGLGLGLSIARQNITAEGGDLSVKDLPGTGCIFTVSLPRHTLGT